MILFQVSPCYAEKGKRIKVTAYNPVASQCDKSPDKAASGLKLKKNHHDKKVIALSRDLAKKHEFGNKFQLIIDNEVYKVEFHDTMNKRFRNRADLLMFDRKMAREFGVKEGILIKVD